MSGFTAVWLSSSILVPSLREIHKQHEVCSSDTGILAIGYKYMLQYCLGQTKLRVHLDRYVREEKTVSSHQPSNASQTTKMPIWALWS